MKDALEDLPSLLRVAFAALSAERLIRAYEVHVNKSNKGNLGLSAVLERLWRDLSGSPMSSDELQTSIEVCMQSMPNDDDAVGEHAYAEDAAASLCYALRTRQNGSAQEAAWAARRAYEALDQFVIAQQGLKNTSSIDEEQLNSHPAIQSELRRQHQDLADLKSLSRSGEHEGLLALRRRAQADAERFFAADKPLPH